MAQASRLRLPSWRDPRLGVGIVLVALSVALGWWLVDSASHRVPVLSATRVLVPGDQLAGNVAVVEVDPDVAEHYLGPDTDYNGLVDRVVGQGELVPAGAVVSAVDQRTVVVPSGTQIPSGVAPGRAVELWFTPQADRDQTSSPQLVADSLTVREVVTDASFLASQFGGVEVIVPPDVLPDVLAAMASDGSLVIVPQG